ncbi:MAG: redoxin domain-containing protein [Clostridiales bacterium]|nr:redoxin domain-containing protein [Clostridiales bacterium]
MKKQICLFIAIFLLAVVNFSGAAMAESGFYQLGDKMEDFTATTYDGKTFSLYEALKEKEMVLINLWATWCNPCRMEFPYMEEAWQQYSDKVEIIALSCEPSDTDTVLQDFASEMGLTFNIAQDTANVSSRFAVDGIPTSIVVDRFGTICLILTGSQTEAGNFTRLFDAFLGENYTQSRLFEGLPGKIPDAAAASAEELNAALKGEGNITFANSDDMYVWPMTIAQVDGRDAVVSSNAGESETTAAVCMQVTAAAGDVLAVDFKLSSESAFDFMKIVVDGETVKSFSGERDWMRYAYAFEDAGEYDVEIRYAKNAQKDLGEDSLWIDAVSLLSGDAAQIALAENPAYPHSEKNAAFPVNAGAREVIVEGAENFLQYYFGDVKLFVIPDDAIQMRFELKEGVDPESAVVVSDYNGQVISLAEIMTENGYNMQTGVDTAETTGYPYSTVYFYPNHEKTGVVYSVLYFADEENLEIFLNANLPGYEWKYAGEENANAAILNEKGEALYTLRFADAEGNPVPGVMAQVCNDDICMVYAADEKGVCEVYLAPFPYEIHILKAPEGYDSETENVVLAPANGGEVTIVLERK